MLVEPARSPDGAELGDRRRVVAAEAKVPFFKREISFRRKRDGRSSSGRGRRSSDEHDRRDRRRGHDRVEADAVDESDRAPDVDDTDVLERAEVEASAAR